MTGKGSPAWVATEVVREIIRPSSFQFSACQKHRSALQKWPLSEACRGGSDAPASWRRLPFVIQGSPSLSEAGSAEDGAAQLQHPRVPLQSPALPCSWCCAGRSVPHVRCLVSPARWPRATGKVFLAGCFHEVFCSPSGT